MTPDGLRLKPLVAMLCEALEAPPRSSAATARCSAWGTCRCSSPGSSPRASRRKLIDIDYHIAMGGRAYGQLAQATARGRGRVLAAVFAELSEKFQPMVDALNEVSEGSAGALGPDILRLYEIWLKTGSARCYAQLKRLGVDPAPPAAPRSRTDRMLLSRLQNLIGGIYDVSIAHDVYDFLVTDRGRLPAAARSGTAEEELIVAQRRRAPMRWRMSLYLDPALLERLTREDPLQRLHAGNVADWWTALEGVSHFLYLAWNAGHDKPVSLLELEMQAEVDKYVASYWLLRRQFPRALSGRAAARAVRAHAHRSARVRRHGRICTARRAATRKSSAGASSGRSRRRTAGAGDAEVLARAAALLPPRPRAQARTHRRNGRLSGTARAARSSVPAAVALALLELAHALDPLGELAQIGARAVAALARRAVRVRIVALIGLDAQPGLAAHLEHRALVVRGRVAPADRGIASVVVHDGTDAAALGLRDLLPRERVFSCSARSQIM